jgi:hypothetical protein
MAVLPSVGDECLLSGLNAALCSLEMRLVAIVF